MTLVFAAILVMGLLAGIGACHQDGLTTFAIITVDLAYPPGPAARALAVLAALAVVALYVVSGGLRVATFAFGAACIGTNALAERIASAVPVDGTGRKELLP